MNFPSWHSRLLTSWPHLITRQLLHSTALSPHPTAARTTNRVNTFPAQSFCSTAGFWNALPPSSAVPFIQQMLLQPLCTGDRVLRTPRWTKECSLGIPWDIHIQLLYPYLPHPMPWYLVPLSSKCLLDNPRHVPFPPIFTVHTTCCWHPMTQLTSVYCLILLSDYPSKPVSWKLLKLVHTFNCVWFTIAQAPSMLLAHFLRITSSAWWMLSKYML